MARPRIYIKSTAVIYNPKDMFNDMFKELRSIQEGARVQLKKTTKTWSKPVVFFVKRKQSADAYELTLGTEDKLWIMLNDGTESHLIAPTKAAFLLFPGSKYESKTLPNQLLSVHGGYRDNGFVIGSKEGIMHPGTEARNWIGLVEEYVDARVLKSMKVAVDIWVRTENSGGKQA